MQFFLQLFIFIILLCVSSASHAGTRASASMMGALGLNTVPSARMDETGMARTGAAMIDPYLHASASFQIAEPFNITVRQSLLTKDLTGPADRLYPGVDLRLRLFKETSYRPEATIGIQSALGHKQMAGEYLALSKRYKNFDFTGGMAWGRLGSAAHMSNPMKGISDHFGKRRMLYGEEPNQINNWFTGEDVGFFAGVEYFVPEFQGFSVKADWGADRYIAEQVLSDYDPPKPWAVGFNFAPKDWISFGGALIGGEKIMGQLTLQSPIKKWLGRSHEKRKAPYMRAYRTGLGLPQEMQNAAARDAIRLYQTRSNVYSAQTQLLLDPFRPTPLQLGHAARHMANHGGGYIEEMRIIPMACGLEGPEVSLQRRDFEQALIYKQGSPQEIWRNVKLSPHADKGIFNDRFNNYDVHTLRFVLDQQISLSEEDSGLLYRTALLMEESRKLSEHFWAGGTVRLDLFDNLYRVHELRPRSVLPVRDDVDRFAKRTISVDRTFLSWMTTIKPDLHVGMTAGYLEEMYAGVGGEILYRPFGKTFAIGAEAWQVFKRDPYTSMNFGLNGDSLLTGHVQAWYEFPNSDVTMQARFGRYLGEDIGGTLALNRKFENGAELEAFVTSTDLVDIDVFGSATHIYSGLKLSLPLGNLKHIPEGSEVRLTASPFGRDAGQALDKPVDLYKISNVISSRHLAQYWNQIVD